MTSQVTTRAKDLVPLTQEGWTRGAERWAWVLLMGFMLVLGGCVPAGNAPPRASIAPPTSTRAPVAASTPVGPSATAGLPSASLFDGQRSYADVLAQMKFGKRDAGTPGNRKTSDYIAQELQEAGWSVEFQDFTYAQTPIRNVIGKRGQGPRVILGAHFDTRKYADQDKTQPQAPVPGANDAASGVAVLLELGRVMRADQLKNEVWLTFFDAEDNGDIDGWPWSVGATHVAESLTAAPQAVIVLDMIGDADQNIYYEANSDRALQKALFDTAAELGYGQYFIPQVRWPMIDDHTPFLNKGYRAVDLIDFDYPYWHTVQDTADKVSAASLERVGRVLQAWLTGVR